MQHESETPTNAALSDSDLLDLPDDAIQLANRLHVEAMGLAKRYPPPAASSKAEPIGRKRAWRAVAGGMVAGGVALTVAVAVVVNGGGDDSPTREKQPLVSTSTPSVETEATVKVTAAAAKPGDEQTPHLSSGDDAAGILRNVSGPELEGLLDLWEAEDESQTSISI